MRRTESGIEEPEAGATAQSRVRERVYPGKGGSEEAGMWAKAGGNEGFDPANELLTRIYPALPASARINFFGQAGLGTNQAGLGTRVEEAEGADLCGKKCGFSREVSQKFTKVRTDQARKSSIVRIFTGKA